MKEIILKEPPIFTEEKLKEILHYTDLDVNPTYDAYKSSSRYKIFCGAKGVSKSFSAMVMTVYRIVNEKNFCSAWCRNRYKHIPTTLRPTLDQVLAYLKDVHNLDYRPYFTFYQERVFWNYDDGGLGRAIYFMNFENPQSFQGFALEKPSYRFGELVIDEPIEDMDAVESEDKLEKIYEEQMRGLPVLFQSTIDRNAIPDNSFKKYIVFLFNIFTLDHFLVRDYLNKVIPIVDSIGKPNFALMNKLIENNYLQAEDMSFEKSGITATMFTKLFIPKKFIDQTQLNAYEVLKEKNYRLWVVTVVGFGMNSTSNRIKYFMKPIIYNEDGSYQKNIKLITDSAFHKMLKSGEISGIYIGYDSGLRDKSSFVATAYNQKTCQAVVFKVIEDLKKLITNKAINVNKAVNKIIIKELKKIDRMLNRYLPYKSFWKNSFRTGVKALILNDNVGVIQDLNYALTEAKMFKEFKALKAVRRTTSNLNFGIKMRQTWMERAFSNSLILLTKNNSRLLDILAKQVIIPAKSDQRDETINRDIYDVVNAFEYSCSRFATNQFLELSNLLDTEEREDLLVEIRRNRHDIKQFN